MSVGIIGMGAQGLAHGRGYATLAGASLAGVTDPDVERLRHAAAKLDLAEKRCFATADEMLATADFDLVSIATTAPNHLDLAGAALAAGVKHIVVEKPLDTSLLKARAFVLEHGKPGVVVAVNYSRRWLPDFIGMRSIIERGFIGSLRSAHFAIGRGELAMIASHYFDLAAFLLNDSAVSVQANLEQESRPNRRGSSYFDPGGHCSFIFSGGQRAVFDFSSDFLHKGAQILLKGTQGHIFVDEEHLVWSIQQDGQLRWEIPFGESIRADDAFARVAAAVLNQGAEGCNCTPEDGLNVLEMIMGTFASAQQSGAPVDLPLADALIPTVTFP